MANTPGIPIVITLEATPDGGRYVARAEGKPDAVMTFRTTGAGVITIDHTRVPEALGGMGVGQALVEHMVHDVRARGLKVVPQCPFTRAMLQRHPDWQDVLKDPF